MPKHVISKNVECPWCGAEPGENCNEPDGRGGARQMYGGGHLARLELVEDDQEAPNGPSSP